MNKIIRLLLLLITVAGVCGCDKDTMEYNSQYPCYFSFDTSLHNTSLLLSAVNPLSSGFFAMATKVSGTGTSYTVRVSLYGGQSQDDKVTTAEELRRSCVMGVDNGLIIGCSSLNDGVLYAFDLQCPNCLDTNYPVTKCPLTWARSGQWVTCQDCHRSYDLNNGGIVIDGPSGKKLIRYRTSYDGRLLVVSDR